MDKLILNIGLNVGYIEPKTQLDRTAFHVEQLFPNSTTTVKDNLGGDWGKERIMIVSIDTDCPLDLLLLALEDLCFRLSQNAISYNLNSEYKGLAFAKSYEGERYEYNEAYFLRK